MLLPVKDVPAIESANRTIRELLHANSEWFLTQDGAAPLALTTTEFDFSIAHRRLIFSSWTETGSRSWRVKAWNWTGEKLLLDASRRMGAEVAKLELVPRASAKAIVASITAARQARCEKLAQIVAETFEDVGGMWGLDRNDLHTEPKIPNPRLPRVDSSELHPKPNPQPPEPHRLKSMLLSAKIERAVLSPGMRRDQPGRYARIVLRLPHERVAVTGTVARSDVRNVDSLFSSALLWFARVQSAPKRPPINRLLVVVDPHILEAARQRHVLLRDSLRQRIELLKIDDEWQTVEPTAGWERKYLWRKRLVRFPPRLESSSTERVHEIVRHAPGAIDVVASRHGQTLRY